ncbi:conserved protein of unknown function [Candidatus Filomicrobium marinum]|uniref:CheW-like domain-containing protein n=2 Tax=Filomicrobium TaxID=119044 RepID=A0A0D6JIZ9_9HYPH|nr:MULTISPECIES: chemotaxis protein CheW [Filomicrobium]MCV0370913.1 chemotaxis protein CheW [Filomicrobium sp.]CFX33247.1 conserved protein of unknown function [Candidatus Filomicrobium marinum]CPR21928.1 conserved protein of unknown function [Candidatus Filomicrobium marinum]SDP48519.1 purine-binding chemotaxis protein CheW [Filomicrobium insigne]
MADMAQYVTLGIASELLAVPVERVQEILEVQLVSRLPHAPDYLLGMIDVRGQGVPVVDLCRKLGFDASEDTENTRIIVLNVTVSGRELTFGLKTDRVFEVTVLDEPDLEPPPEIGVKWRSEFIAGIGRRHRAFVTVLDLNRLFEASEISVIAPSNQADGRAA